MQKVVAKIHLGSIRRNAQAFSRLTKTKLCAVVKANAYGHGAEEVVGALQGVAHCFAVSLLDEGLAIRTAACGKDILVLTPPVCEEEAFALGVNGFIASVPDLWTARLLCRVSEKYRLPMRVHLKINTGMNRYGMNACTLGKVCVFLRDKPLVLVEGMYSHLYATDIQTAESQRLLFQNAVKIGRGYFPRLTAHLSATYGSLLGKSFAFDMCRVGIGLYGYLPTDMQEEAFARGSALALEKGMSVYAKTVASRRYAFGGAGYGTPSVSIEKGERLSVCRCGYADGFLRKRENGTVGAHENINNLCMDVCIRANAKKRGEEVPVLTDADETALATGTISYEVLCAATRRAEFVYDED